MMTYEEVWKT